MKHNKVTRLTERDLNRLVRRILREQEIENEGWKKASENEYLQAITDGMEVKSEGCPGDIDDCPNATYYIKQA